MRRAVKNTSILALLFGVFLVSGCCATKNVAERRLLRLANCHPSLIVQTEPDTIVISETYVDTLVTLLGGDTLIVEKERLKMRVIRLYDTLRVEGACQPDTLYITKQIAVAKETEYKMKKINWYLFFWAFLLAVILVFKR